MLPELPLLPPPDGGGGLPLGLDGLVGVLDGLDDVDVDGHLSLLGMTEPSGHNLFLLFKPSGLFGFNVDCVGHLPLESGCDPSGHILVVGDVGGGAKVCVQDGSLGFFEQSTVGGGPEVQLPAAHVDPDPFPPPDVGIDVLVGCIAADVLLGGLNKRDDMLDVLVDVVLVPLTGTVEFTVRVILVLGITVNVADFEADL